MHQDLNQLDPQTFSATVCIIGAGIAGLALATRLAAAGVDVHLLEAGGLEQEEASQAFYQTEQPATEHRGAHTGRFRTFGGSSTQWGGQLLPFTADIFTPPAGVPSRPWPVTESELTPYYAAIQQIYGTDQLPFDAALLPALGHAPVPFSADITLRYSKWAPFNKRNVALTLGAQARSHGSLTVFTHSNAAELMGTAGHITAVRVLNYAGAEFRFQARYFVVAAGTIESSRLLLCSAAAVPDPHDQLGRYFNDHVAFHAGRFTGAARTRMLERLGPFFVDGTLHTCKLEASAETRAAHHLLACMAHIIITEPEDSGAAALRNLLRSVQAGNLREALGKNILPMLRGLPDVVRLAYNARFRRRRAVSSRAQVILGSDVEQQSDHENRIRLSLQNDALGLPKAVVDWRVNQAEQRTALSFAGILRAELERLQLAPETWSDAVTHGTLPAMLDTYHAMGGLCMGTDPSTSVVTQHLRHHSVGNLYVASCAVFPSGSSSNPTFTMLALTLRLADQLLGQLGA